MYFTIIMPASWIEPYFKFRVLRFFRVLIIYVVLLELSNWPRLHTDNTPWEQFSIDFRLKFYLFFCQITNLTKKDEEWKKPHEAFFFKLLKFPIRNPCQSPPLNIASGTWFVSFHCGSLLNNSPHTRYFFHRFQNI